MDLSRKLRQVRENLTLTLAEVSEKTGIGVSSLSEFENGKRDPGLRHLQLLGAIYRKSLSYLLGESEPTADVILWRKRPEQKVAAQIEAEFSRLCEQYHNLERWCDDHVPTELPSWDRCLTPSEFSYGHAEELAQHVRNDLQLGDRPGQSLLRVLEEVCGIKIFHLSTLPNGAAACTVNSGFGCAVLLNSSSPQWRRNFDLAHELFHLLTWDIFRACNERSAMQADDKEELLADRFARALLMPAEPTRIAVLKATKKGQLEWCDVFDMARQYDVSFETILWRISVLFGIAEEDTKRLLETGAKAAELFESRIPNTPPKRPQRFQALAVQCLNRGHMSSGRFAEYLDITRQEAQSYVAHDAVDNETIEIPAA